MNSVATTPAPAPNSIALLAKSLRLPTVASCYEEIAATAAAQGWSHCQFLSNLLQMETDERRVRRIERNLKKSGLPREKTRATLDLGKLPAKVRKLFPALCEGDFADRAENVLAFGNPGTGKSHLAAAIGHELIHKGYQVLFIPTFRLVQRLLVAKRALELEPMLRRLDRFDVVMLDDIGYVQQDRDEMEVLFSFLSERYERRSVLITSNLVFSQWDKIFKDSLTTAAAVDRVVHHATILELAGKSYRTESARAKNKASKNQNQPTEHES